MNKCLLSLLFLLMALVVLGQKKPKVQQAAASTGKKSKVTLISSRTLEKVLGANGKTILKVHDGLFQQDYSTLRSDSAYYYTDLNTVDAFGHVVIQQGDTLTIFSDKLNYNGNTKLAILTDHVKMIDKDATLTTDYLTYNTATRIAIYTGGGKLVNKENTLTSKNGYYFSFTRDAYFRYNVVCKTPDALIKTDTLRYNSGTRISYFYGPTHIYGTKDNDTLYTEDGNYNTVNEQARFGKKNLYSQGTKTLKGDSLFYDRLKGYGRAVKNITFNDNEQKATIKGGLGEFYKAEDRAVVTDHPYVIFVTEDTVKTNTGAAKTTVPLTKEQTSKKPVVQTKTDSVTAKRLGLAPAVKAKPDVAGTNTPVPKNAVNNKVKSKSDTLRKTKITVGKEKADTMRLTKKDTTVHIRKDSLFMASDTLETRILIWKDLKKLQRERYEVNNRDTTIKVIKHAVMTSLPKFIELAPPHLAPDTSFYHRDYFGKPKPKPVPIVKKKPVKPVDPKKLAADSIRNKRIADSLEVLSNHGLQDTSRVRIITGHHHSKIFKSDLQAKSDSLFYSYADSTIRMYYKPMIWTQGSQLSGDTIYLQMKNRKLDNMDQFPSAFMVNIDKSDSLHFNQMGGLKMHGIFKDSKLNTMLVTGNAETIAFSRDSATNKVKDMVRSLSSSLRINLKDGQLNRITYLIRPDIRVLPYKEAKDEDKILKGFIWKPKDRPASKEAVIGFNTPPVIKKAAPPKGPVKGSMPVKDKPQSSKLKSIGKAIKNPVNTIVPIMKPIIDTGKFLKRDTAVKKVDTTKKMVIKG